VLNGLQPGSEAICAASGIVPVLNSLEQAANWRRLAELKSTNLPAVLQFDTGMSRLGLSPQERAELASDPTLLDRIELLFVMSHLASADEPQSVQNTDQQAAMRDVAAQFPGVDICFANSGGIFLGPDYRGALARPGIALYGGAPVAGGANPMRPVVGLQVRVVQTRTVSAGAKVGYSATHVTAHETRLATIACGYADGLPRQLSGRGAVFFQGVRLPIVGRVSMDSITVDVSALAPGTLSLGSLVEIIGPHQSLEQLAADAQTIAYEILTSLGHRYHREYR
jgi:alanine racemase